MPSDESEIYEIVELENGDVGLCKIEGEGEPLVSIRFSGESLSYLGDIKFDVAKAMLEAGLDAVAELGEAEFDAIEVDHERVIH